MPPKFDPNEIKVISTYHLKMEEGKRKKKIFRSKKYEGKKWKILTSGDQVPRCRRRNGSHQLFGSKGLFFVLLLNICWCIIVCLIDWKVVLFGPKVFISNSICIYLVGKFCLIVLFNVTWSVRKKFYTLDLNWIS